MRAVKWGIQAIAVLLLTTGSALATTEVQGRVVCAGTDTGIPDVIVTIGDATLSYSDATDATGLFDFFATQGEAGFYPVNLNLTAVGGPATFAAGSVYVDYGTPWVVGPFEVDVPWCAPPPPPVCTQLADETERSFCLPKPIGKAAAECSYFGDGLVVLGKDEFNSTSATMAADLALVKAGNCYRVYLGVVTGDALESPPNAGSISHVTYCGCP